MEDYHRLIVEHNGNNSNNDTINKIDSFCEDKISQNFDNNYSFVRDEANSSRFLESTQKFMVSQRIEDSYIPPKSEITEQSLNQNSFREQKMDKYLEEEP